ncbi:ybfB [Symbiodinium sp. CCMP2456]|nr:ybfB [Symbiodinium sp. CCMP2456]
MALAEDALSTDCKCYCIPASLQKSEFVLHWKQMFSIWVFFFVTAGVTYHTPPVLLPAIMQEFHTDQFHVSWLPSIFYLVKGIFTIPGGYAVDSLGCSTCLRAGAIALVVSSALYSVAPSLWCLACLHGVYGLCYDLSGIATGTVFLTSWFEQQRALAISVMATAFSMAGVCFPPAIGTLIHDHGWRVASMLGPCLTALLAVPLSCLVLRDGPLRSREELGQLQSLRGDREGDDHDLPMSFQQCLRLGVVWYIIMALINSLVLYLQKDVGMSVQVCSLYTSMVFQASSAGKLIAGAAMDSRQILTGAVSCFLLVLGTLLPLDFASGGVEVTSNHSQLLAFTIIYGLGFGASYAVLMAKPAKMFGQLAEFSKLQGFLMLFQVLGGFCGTLITGKLRSATGSYAAAFHVFIAMASVTCFNYVAVEMSKTSRRLRQV